VAFAQGCNTVQGIGKDLSAAGDKIEKTADKNKKY
jgi:predicted small secreted protein